MRSRNGNQCSNAALSELQEKMPAIVKRNLLRNTGNMINTIEDVEKFVGKLPTEKYFMFLSRGKVAELVPPTFFLGKKTLISILYISSLDYIWLCLLSYIMMLSYYFCVFLFVNM